MRLAAQLDPISSRALLNSSSLHYFAREYDNALREVRRAQGLNADPAEIHFPLAVVYVETGHLQEAIEEFQKLGDAPHAVGHMGNALARAGRVAEARAAIVKLQQDVAQTGIGNYEIALVYIGLKENDNAFVWLEKAFAARDKGMLYLKIDPCLDPIRSDPRFQSFLHRVGFPASR